MQASESESDTEPESETDAVAKAEAARVAEEMEKEREAQVARLKEQQASDHRPDAIPGGGPRCPLQQGGGQVDGEAE